MYTTNLPDEVMIPDLLLRHVESGVLDDQAKSDALTWVTRWKGADEDMKSFWVRHIKGNISSCKKYGVPEVVRLFSYVYELIETSW